MADSVAVPETRPELVVCLCVAAGTDTRIVTDAFSEALLAVNYKPVPLRLSKLMAQIPGLQFLSEISQEDLRIRRSMDADAIARIALSEIHNVRETLNDDKDASVPAEGRCFILSSLKRAEELETLRRLFGQRVLLASVYEPKVARIDNLCRSIARSRNSPNPESFCDIAEEIIATDQKEHSNTFGQRLEEVFQNADVFLAAGKSLREDVRRFIQLLFRAPYITPSVDESLMVRARSAAHRSADLSRQVGAVIATTKGEILATGCNEVPRAGGGVLWDDVAGTDRDYRDYKFGQDPAAGTRKDIAVSLFEGSL
jgi:deoxycytidylate deaminase